MFMYKMSKDQSLIQNQRGCIFLWYEKGVNGYKLWDPTTHKAVINGDVFDEEYMINSNKEATNQQAGGDSQKTSIQVQLEGNEWPYEKTYML